MTIGDSISGEMFSGLETKHRYALWRIWQPSQKKLLFIGLNPSTANSAKNRLIGFAKSWGFGGLFVGNLFSLVTPDPDLLWVTPLESYNHMNDRTIKHMCELSAKVMVGWGNWGSMAGKRPIEVLSLLGEPVYCLKTIQNGEPGHPLYIKAGAELELYKRN